MFDYVITLFGLDINLFEAVGAIVGIIYLLLEYKAHPWLWFFGLLMPLFYIYLFFDQRLYANATINVYYVWASVYGILCWRGILGSRQKDESPITSMPRSALWPTVGSIAVVTLVLTLVLQWLGESQVAWLDGFTAALNVVGMFMLARGWYQQWICWIIVEPVMVVMSLLTGMYPTAVMYLVYCVIAVMGYLRWKKEYFANKKQ